ncbi:MAG: type II toxin-antitoxin system ParD family antitoxin [Gammaproteobacteria bacterium]
MQPWDRRAPARPGLWHIMPTRLPSPRMPTRNVVLTDHQAALVDRLVKSGRYQNASEVLREGLRLIETQDAEDRARLKALRDAAKVGIDDLESGRFLEFASADDLGEYLARVAGERIRERIRSIAK